MYFAQPMRERLVRLLCVLPVVSLGFGISSTASADPFDINSMAVNVQPSKVFDVSDGQWQIQNVGVLNGTITTDGGDLFFYDGSMNWVSNLDQDLSPGGAPPTQAHATFQTGGIMAITGTIYDIFFTPLHTGLLFEAWVSAFELRETNAQSNLVDTIGLVVVNPYDGYLVNGGGNNFALLRTNYEFGMQFTGGRSNGGDLENWTDNDVFSRGGSQWNMTQVPEPATLGLLGLGLTGLVLRRKSAQV